MNSQAHLGEVLGGGVLIGIVAFLLQTLGLQKFEMIFLLSGSIVVTVWLIWRAIQHWPPNSQV